MLIDEDSYFLKPNPKMLFLFKFLSEKNYAKKKKINAAGDSRIIFNCIPRGFHFTAPVNIIKNEN